jgi:hypothetical protein
MYLSHMCVLFAFCICLILWTLKFAPVAAELACESKELKNIIIIMFLTLEGKIRLLEVPKILQCFCQLL